MSLGGIPRGLERMTTLSVNTSRKKTFLFVPGFTGDVGAAKLALTRENIGQSLLLPFGSERLALLLFEHGAVSGSRPDNPKSRGSLGRGMSAQFDHIGGLNE